MNEIYDLYKRRFKISLEQFKDSVFQRNLGSYTKSYETYKKLKNIVTCFKQEIKKDKLFKVLDARCGNGYHIFLLNMLKEVKEKVSFDGVDISELEIEFAREVNNSFGFNNINFRVGDAEHLEFPQNSFDIILCNDVLEHLKKT
ncbi:MAG: class I SAM-dependent methyltransferase [bacterium]|nr:class I SAM-dependent methyltransferase [bacterium]